MESWIRAAPRARLAVLWSTVTVNNMQTFDCELSKYNHVQNSIPPCQLHSSVLQPPMASGSHLGQETEYFHSLKHSPGQGQKVCSWREPRVSAVALSVTWLLQQ